MVEEEEESQEAIEPITPNKRPLEDAGEVDATAPDMKRVRETEENELMVPVNSSVPQMSSSEVAVVPSQQPIHTGGD